VGGWVGGWMDGWMDGWQSSLWEVTKKPVIALKLPPFFTPQAPKFASLSVTFVLGLTNNTVFYNDKISVQTTERAMSLCIQTTCHCAYRQHVIVRTDNISLCVQTCHCTYRQHVVKNCFLYGMAHYASSKHCPRQKTFDHKRAWGYSI
jgi:hypothetical protein